MPTFLTGEKVRKGRPRYFESKCNNERLTDHLCEDRLPVLHVSVKLKVVANCLGAGSWFLQGSSNPDISFLSLLRAPLHSCSSSRRSVKRLGTGRSTSCETDWRMLSFTQEAAVWIINYPSIVTEGPPLTGLPRLLLPFLYLLTAGVRPSQLRVKDKHADFHLSYPCIRKKFSLASTLL